MPRAAPEEPLIWPLLPVIRAAMLIAGLRPEGSGAPEACP